MCTECSRVLGVLPCMYGGVTVRARIVAVGPRSVAVRAGNVTVRAGNVTVRAEKISVCGYYRVCLECHRAY